MTEAVYARLATLVGGSRNGEKHSVRPWQRILYLGKRLSLEEDLALKIDDAISWKAPDEVYEKWSDGSFRYSHTVDYKLPTEDASTPPAPQQSQHKPTRCAG